jgi:hypothetical protein
VHVVVADDGDCQKGEQEPAKGEAMCADLGGDDERPEPCEDDDLCSVHLDPLCVISISTGSTLVEDVCSVIGAGVDFCGPLHSTCGWTISIYAA